MRAENARDIPLIEDVTPKPVPPTFWKRHEFAIHVVARLIFGGLILGGLLAMCADEQNGQRKREAERCVRAGPVLGVETKYDKDFGCLVKTTSGIWERYYP